ncbi:MAG: pseudouridine synthase [Nitrospiria bacterium]
MNSLNHRKKITLSRALSKMGISSRMVACDLIKAGKVKIGQKIIKDPEFKVEIPIRNLLVNNQPAKEPQKVYYMMHKPKGIITTRSDEKGRKTIYDLLTSEFPWIFPVGRLDKETSGLLLLTNDTVWGNQMASPTQEVPKTYHVKLNRNVKDEELKKLRDGLSLSAEQTYLPVKVEKIRENSKTCWVEITLEEGKNRQIRKMFEHLSYQVENLVRIKIGNLTLGTLKPGEIRPITPYEV